MPGWAIPYLCLVISIVSLILDISFAGHLVFPLRRGVTPSYDNLGKVLVND